MAHRLMGRVLAMIVKELWAVLRDPRARISLIAPPLLQLVLFSAAATLEIKHVDIGVYDRDHGVWSAEFISQLAGSPTVDHIVRIDSPQALSAAIDDRKVIGVLTFDETFSRDIAAGRTGTVSAILDGRRSNAAQIVGGYLQRIAGSVGATVRPQLRPTGETVVTHGFNPNLDYIWFMLPTLLVQISAMSAMAVASQTVARERELGTFDQLMVSPLRVYEILIGKMVPPMIIGMFNATVYLILIPLVFGVPLLGSVAVFYLALFVYLLAAIGLGMVISTVTHTQQQAFLGMFMIIVPSVLLSGFASPVENMPPWLQILAQADPMKHFVVIAEGVFLKAMPAADILANVWPLAVIATFTLGIATVLFRSRVE